MCLLLIYILVLNINILFLEQFQFHSNIEVQRVACVFSTYTYTVFPHQQPAFTWLQIFQLVTSLTHDHPIHNLHQCLFFVLHMIWILTSKYVSANIIHRIARCPKLGMLQCYIYFLTKPYYCCFFFFFNSSWFK